MSVFLKEGTLFSGCKILSRCGRGAFGVTYLAQTPLDEKIIIKMISSPAGAEKELKGVRSYMQIAGKHPNLLQIFHSGVTEEGFFYTMEAADNCGSDGEYRPATLSNLLKKYHSFTPEEAIRIIRELLEAVQVMHEAKLIHRDIKPENIIFVKGRPKLSDPGLVTEVGKTVSFAGTFGFLPPECFSGTVPISENGDLYALGMVFYCMVTGFPPKDYPRLPLDMRIEVCRQLTPALFRMCNRNPGKRFRTAGEFLAGLPEKLENPTPFEKYLQEFRNWKSCNRNLLRWITFILVAAVLLLAGAGTAGTFYYQRRQQQLLAWQQEYKEFKSRDGKRRELLEFQLENYFPELSCSYCQLKEKLEKDAAQNRWQQAAAGSRKIEQLLKTGAVKHLDALLRQNPSEAQEIFALSGAFHGFLTTPLAAFAPETEIRAAKKKISITEKKIYDAWTGPRCGREWFSFQYHDTRLVFMPPGALRMRHNGKLVRIPYHYWIGKFEVTGEDYSMQMHVNPRRSGVNGTPVERVVWNDFLYYCYVLNKRLQRSGCLPPGYILRPPTEAEWEFAARNGWLGEDEPPIEKRAVIKSNSGGRTHAAGSKAPSKSGIYDIYGNVAEMVLPLEPVTQQLSCIIRGGNYNSSAEDCYNRSPFLRYQCLPNTVGVRFVLAPGESSFYDRHFFLGGAQQIRHGGKVYEIVGGLLAAFRWEEAREFARLLGGELAVFENKEEMAFVHNNLPLLKSWPAHAGVKKIGKKWCFVNNGREVSFGTWRPFRGEGEPLYAACWNNRWYPVSTISLPVFLCQWQEKEYPRRNRHLDSASKLPLELARFTHGDREFILINSKIHWNGAYRVCELLGGRLAVLESEELRKKALSALKDFSHQRINLGAYAKREKWFFLDGTLITFPLKKDPSKDIPGRNRNFVVMHRGEFYDSVYSDAFLFERRRSSFSSSSR